MPDRANVFTAGTPPDPCAGQVSALIRLGRADLLDTIDGT